VIPWVRSKLRRANVVDVVVVFFSGRAASDGSPGPTVALHELKSLLVRHVNEARDCIVLLLLLLLMMMMRPPAVVELLPVVGVAVHPHFAAWVRSAEVLHGVIVIVGPRLPRLSVAF
jgi:hypothetical protein